jgi:hypothetical protein
MKLERRTILALGFDRPVIADRDVQPSVDARAHSIHRVVGPAKPEIETEPFDKLFGTIRDAVAIVIMVGRQKWRMHHVKRVLVKPHTARTIHFREDIELVSATIAVAINATNHTTTIAFRIEGTVLVHADE